MRNIKTHIILRFGGTIVILAVLFSTLFIIMQRNVLIEEIDKDLYNIVRTNKELYPDDFHDHILDENSVSKEDYNIIVDRNNQLCKELGLQYLWSVIQINGKVRFTTATSPDLEIKNKKHAGFFEVHSNPEAFDEVFATMKPVISEFHNEWGNGRMILSPYFDKHGRKYCFGVSQSIEHVNTEVKKSILLSVVILLISLLLFLPIIYFLAKSLSDPIKQITSVANEIANGKSNVSIPVAQKQWTEIFSLNHSIKLMYEEIQTKIGALERAKAQLEKNEEVLKDQNVNLDKKVVERTEELNKAKELAEKSEVQFRQLFENMEQGFALHEMIYDENNKPFDYRFILINDAFEKLTGLKRDNIIGNTVRELMPDTEQIWIDNFGKVAQEGLLYHFDNYSQELKKYYEVVAYSPKKNYFAVIFSDVTKIKEYHQELLKAKVKAEESEKQLKRIANNFVDGMIYQVAMLDEEKRQFNYVSDAVNKLYGCTPEQALEDSSLIYGRIHKDDVENLLKKEKEALKNMSIFRTECRVINPDGTIRWSYYVSQPTIINGVVCWDGIEIDLTKQKNIENELTKAKEAAEESNRLKTEFISNMSHEIRTPMNGIIGFSEFLDDEDLSAEKRKYFTSIIKNSGHQLLRIIDDILEISRLGTKQVRINEKEIVLNDLLLEQFSIFDIKAKEKKIPLYLKNGLSDKESRIICDDIKLVKIISNLLENALKFTQSGFIEIGYEVRNNELEIYVKDTGIGINEDKQEIIFERFLQEEREISKNVGGLGLGLSIAKENTELLGGKITLKSKKGKGSVFYVTIPYKRAISEDDEIVILENEDKSRRCTLLIAEDEEINFLFLETILKARFKQNCDILHAKNGQEAVDIIQNNPDVDLIFMDIKMPIMNGFEATRLIKEMQPDIPVVVQTAYTSREDIEKAFASGCNEFITKPISIDHLNEVLDKMLNVV